MPRILEYTPAWLSRPSLGFQIFSDSPQTEQANGTPAQSSVAKLMARRGTQIFLVVENELRWTDLMYLKDWYESESQAKQRKTAVLSDSTIPETIFRVVKVPVKEKIVSLSVSPQGDYLAIMTAHTVHIAMIYDNYDVDIGPMKLKTFQLGSIEHRTDTSPLVVGLWHPLGISGRCFVTITEDSVVRLWELNREDRSSFERSALSIDLKKLANAEDEKSSLGASIYGAGKAFTPDAAYLEPCAASFGGIGRNGENPWSCMTLWIAMTDGDLYALCPLLPTRFQGFPGLVNSLSSFLDAKGKEVMNNSDATAQEEENLRQQTIWIQDIEDQEPFLSGLSSYGTHAEVFTRPLAPRPEPKLQGPFDFGEEDIDIVELFVRNVSVSEDPLELETGEFLIDENEDNLPLEVSILCILESKNLLHVVLDLDGVEPKWLPFKTPHSTPRKKSTSLTITEEDDSRSLLPIGTVHVGKSDQSPIASAITPDVRSAYCFYITTLSGVTHVSLDGLVERLQAELIDPSEVGTEFRADMVLKSNLNMEQVIKFDASQKHSQKTILAANAFLEPELGYFVLTSVNGHPHAITFDTRYHDLNLSILSENQRMVESRELYESLQLTTRRPYEIDDRLYEDTEVTNFLSSLRSRDSINLRENIHLSAEVLIALIDAHQYFGSTSHSLSEDVARIFRAAKRLNIEYEDQLETVRDLARRIEGITGEDEENFSNEYKEAGRVRLEGRIHRVEKEQLELMKKYKALQKKLGKLTGRQLSDEEKKFAHEVQVIDDDLNSGDDEDQDAGALHGRRNDLKVLHSEVVKSSENIPDESNNNASPIRNSKQAPSGIRKAKIQKVIQLLERETAVIDSTTERLARLRQVLQQ